MAEIWDFCVHCHYVDYNPWEEPCKECFRETRKETLGLQFPVNFTTDDDIELDIEDILGY